MTFKKGISGNKNGRPKGAKGKHSQLTKLLEPHATELVGRMIKQALEGDINALRLCIERLIPKIQREPINIELPNNLSEEKASKLKRSILRTVLEGKFSVDDAEKLTRLIDNQIIKEPSFSSFRITTNDPIEASKIYQKIMRGD